MAKLYTEIKSAKVFLNGAEVTRKGKCELTEGKLKCPTNNGQFIKKANDC